MQKLNDEDKKKLLNEWKKIATSRPGENFEI